jgi:hypothetical protein
MCTSSNEYHETAADVKRNAERLALRQLIKKCRFLKIIDEETYDPLYYNRYFIFLNPEEEEEE